MKNLVIVESPAKAKTIEKFLGKDYKVLSSYGHIRDLKRKGVSIDTDGDFTPYYEIPADKSALVKKLKAEAEKAEMVWLASDEDREGEAIAWHLYEVLGLKPDRTKRIVFHEITKPAILAAIEHPRDIDLDRVNAQQARRVLDRLVGFELSPVLWKKIKPSLSAGRVQSVAVRLICEREKEIKAFRSEPYFRVTAEFATAEGGTFKSELSCRLATEQEAEALLAGCLHSRFSVADVSVKPLKRSPHPPFTTSTLQQEAARRLGFSVNQTMMVAQQLYESGHITYMRTDSLNLSGLALKEIADTLKETYGEKYVKVRKYHTKSKGAQEAHEAIRPTYISKTTIEGSPAEKRLYELIRRRTLASQMADALLEKTTVKIVREENAFNAVDPGYFEAQGEVVTFPGYMKLAEADGDDPDTELLPPLAKGMSLTAKTVTATQRFSQPPARYNEASLVKKMEDLGIGRPSTYAPTISTIQTRDYVARGESEGRKRDYVVLEAAADRVERKVMSENVGSQKGKLVPTDVGMVVNDFLTEYFPEILDYNFTARVEEKFDAIAEGKLPWKSEISSFYADFHPAVDSVNAMRMEHKVGERLLGTDPESGKPVYVKIGRFGPVVQIGEASDEEKPRFASLLKKQSLETITLEEALKLFELPRRVGEYEGVEIQAAIGRFGPYVKYGKLFVSIPKDLSAQTINEQEAIELIKHKQEAEANKFIKDFAEMPGLQILNGRFGPYIAYKPQGAKKAVNYRIPKTAVAAELTLEEVQALMKAQDEAPKKKVTRKKK